MDILANLTYVVLGFVILVIGKIVRDLRTSYDDDEELTSKDNPALGVTVAGYYLSIFIVYIAAAQGDIAAMSMEEFIKEMLLASAFAIGGIACLNIGVLILDKVSLPKFSVQKELIQDRNLGMGAVMASAYIGSAIIAAGALTGTGQWYHGLAFWAIGQVALVFFTKFYQLITPYNIHEELEKDNVAAGVSLGLNIIAISIVLFGATGHDFMGWEESLTNFSLLAAVGFVVLAVSRVVCDKMMLPKSPLNKEIATDRNTAAAWIEGSMAIGFAATILFML